MGVLLSKMLWLQLTAAQDVRVQTDGHMPLQTSCLQLALLLRSSVRIDMPYVTLSQAQLAILGSIHSANFQENCQDENLG